MTPLLQQVSNLDGAQFETLCAALVQCTGFTNIIPRKAGTQGGRDIDADAKHPSTAALERWYFECKGYKRGATVPFKEIVTKFLLVQRLSPRPDALVVLCSAQLANDANDYIDSFSADLDFPIIRVTNEPPTMLFDQWVLACQTVALPILNNVGPTSPDPTLPTHNIRDYLWSEKDGRMRPTARTERSLSLHAFPKLSFQHTGGQVHFHVIKGTIKNVGNGFAHSVHMLLLHRGTTIFEKEFTTIAAGASEDFSATTTLDQAVGRSVEVGDSDPLTIVLTYKNALDYSFQSSYVLAATKESRRWKYGPVSPI